MNYYKSVSNDTDYSFAFSCSYEKFYVAIAGYLKGYHTWATFQRVWMQNMKVNVAKNDLSFSKIHGSNGLYDINFTCTCSCLNKIKIYASRILIISIDF